MTKLERLKELCADGIGLNECELAASVPSLLALVEQMSLALRYYAGRGPMVVSGPAASALAALEKWENA